MHSFGNADPLMLTQVIDENEVWGYPSAKVVPVLSWQFLWEEEWEFHMHSV